MIYKEGFNKGYQQLPVGKLAEAKAKLWKALNINNRNSFHNYLYGKQEPTASQAVSVELVFRDYGITEIWGK